MRKNPHGKILKEEPKEQHLNTVPKCCPIIIIIIIISKLSLGIKENISCSYAVMPNCGRRSK